MIELRWVSRTIPGGMRQHERGYYYNEPARHERVLQYRQLAQRRLSGPTEFSHGPHEWPDWQDVPEVAEPPRGAGEGA